MTRRTERIGEQIQQELGMLLLDGVKDPRVQGVSLTGVDVSPDLSSARVFFTVLTPGEPALRAAERGLQSSAAFLRKTLGERLRLRRVPTFDFRHDDTLDRAAPVQRLLDQVNRELVEHPAPVQSEEELAALYSGRRAQLLDDDEEYAADAEDAPLPDEDAPVWTDDDAEEEEHEDERWPTQDEEPGEGSDEDDEPLPVDEQQGLDDEDGVWQDDDAEMPLEADEQEAPDAAGRGAHDHGRR